MLIVCPSCATSYMIEQASLGTGGRMVRCARCKATWYAGGAEEEVSAFVDEVIAEAEAETAEPEPFLRAPAGEPTPPPTVDFGSVHVEAASAGPGAMPAPDISFEIQDTHVTAAHRAGDEPATVADAPPLVPPMHEAAEEADAEADADDVETYAARRQRLKSRRKQAKRSSRWTAAVLVLFAANVALIMGRREVVGYLPQTASLFSSIGLPVNLRQLKFENVHITPSGPSGEGLTVEGTIVSTAAQAVKVPMLRFAARNAAGQEVYVWTRRPARDMLDPGDKLDFGSELASPPADAKDVLVRFVTAHEAADMVSSKDQDMAKRGQAAGDHSDQ